MVDIINCIIGALFGFASELLWRLAAASPICRVERTEDEIAQSEFVRRRPRRLFAPI